MVPSATRGYPGAPDQRTRTDRVTVRAFPAASVAVTRTVRRSARLRSAAAKRDEGFRVSVRRPLPAFSEREPTSTSPVADWNATPVPRRATRANRSPRSFAGSSTVTRRAARGAGMPSG